MIVQISGTMLYSSGDNRVSTASKQDVQIANFGAKADEVATSDTGTFSLIALFKRLLQGIQTLIATTTSNSAIKYSDSPSLDAFGRLRVSSLTTYLDVKQIGGFPTLFVDTELIGTGLRLSEASNSMSVMTVTANGDAVICQTKQRSLYQSGKSQLIFLTFYEFQSVANIQKRVGYFSSSTTTPFTTDLDGLFFQSDGTGISINVYKTGTTINSSPVYQSSWNLDKMDGTGASGIDLNFSNSQIGVIDFEWLGVGRIRFGFSVNGLVYYCHEVLNANNIIGTYMTSSNQPLRWEIRRTSGNGLQSFNWICGSVSSEGAVN